MNEERQVLSDVVGKYFEQMERQRAEDRKERARARRPTYLRWGVTALGILLAFYIATGVGRRADQALNVASRIVDMVPVARKATYVNKQWEGEATLLVLPIQGTISGEPLEQSSGGGGFVGMLSNTENTVQTVRRALEEASMTKNIAELALFIKSPGGEVTPSDEIYSMIRRWRIRHPDVRVSAYFYGIAASGGYYIAMAADTIASQPTSVVGSISVLMQIVNLKEIAARFGVKMTTIKSGELKDLGNLFRDMTEQERSVLNDMIMSSHARFVNVVSAGRSQLERVEVEKLADGRVFSAPEAMRLGLIDSVVETFEDFLEIRVKGIMERRRVGKVHVMYPTNIKRIPEMEIRME